MISFRYHIVSIVAVFLALAVGLLAGSAFVEPELVDQLRTQTNRLRDRVAELEGSLTESRESVEGLDAFVDAALPYLTRNRLLGTGVVIVTLEGMDGAVLSQTQAILAGAGANVIATMSARSALLSDDPTRQAELAEILGRSDAEAADLPSLAAGALAERLAPAERRETDPDADVLNQLLSAGFLEPAGSGVSETALEEVGGFGQVVVVLAGGPGDAPPLEPEAFSVPLVRSLASLGVPVAAGEPLVTDVPFVETIREVDDPGTVTVDDLDRPMGAAALILGLEELLTTGRGSAYGIKDGAVPLPSGP
ncbi:MAG TPA: copper transporter [Actinomycetota bacterium]